MFDVEFSKLAEKQFYKLSKEIQKRIVNTLERIKIRPYSHIKKLVSSPYLGLRIGEYRLILDIKKDKLIIFLIEIGHRRNIEKKF